jgi:hypothetical protein
MAMKSLTLEEVKFFPQVPVVRPYFGKRQIQNLDQIHKGLRIRVRSEDGLDILATVILGPYKKDGIWHLDLEFRKGRDIWQGTVSLPDHSVIRYDNGEWNRANWLERA